MIAQNFDVEFAPGETGEAFENEILDTFTVTLPPLQLKFNPRQGRCRPSILVYSGHCTSPIYTDMFPISSTYDHRFKKIALPVRSAVLKLVTGGLVVRWVTTGESPLLYVFVYASSPSFCSCQRVIVGVEGRH
jgi:hypothetical protein